MEKDSYKGHGDIPSSLGDIPEVAFLCKQRSFSVEGIKLQFLLYKTKMLLFQMAIDEIVIHHIFELSSSLHFAVHSGSIGGIFLDYTASQFLSVYKKEVGANRMPID